MYLYLFYLLRNQQRDKAMKTSIIIPTAGRPIAIKSAIQSLIKIKPEHYAAEIIIVDNNTSSELSDDLKAYCMTLENRVCYVREQSPGLSAARHRGAAEAKSECLTFIDDDVEVSETWLPTIQDAFANPEVAMVGGPSIPKFTCSIPSWFWDYVTPTPYGGWMCSWLSLLDIGKDVPNINPNFIWGLNFSIRKQVMESCGGFHTDLVPSEFQRWQGDGETGLTMKVQAAGYRTDYLQDAILLHLCGPDRLNVGYFQKRGYFQGVCDSYTQIRRGQEPVFELPQQARKTLSRRLLREAAKVWRRLKGQTTPSSLWANEAANVKVLTHQAYRDGWLFHQREVFADPALLAWVRRENYFDTNIR